MPGASARAAASDEELAGAMHAPLMAARAPDNASPNKRQHHHAIAVAIVVGALVVAGAAAAGRASAAAGAAAPASATATKTATTTTTTTNPPNIPPECVTALGGGVMGPGGSLRPMAGRQSADDGASCRSALAAYAALPGGAYWRDVEAAVGVAYAALGISAEEEGALARAHTGGAAAAAPPPRGVVVFDIDETALSNAPLSAAAAAAASSATAGAATAAAAASSATAGAATAAAASPFPTARFSADGARLPSMGDDAPSPALVPTLRLYGALQRQGLAAAFVTGRGEAARAQTEDNLLAAGYGRRCGDKGRGGGGDGDDGAPCYLSLTLRQPGDARPASLYKPEARRQLAAATGLPVVASVGDQWSDISGEELTAAGGGGGGGDRSDAAAAPPPYVAIKLPNPFYYIL
jgi:hypothetical protein